MAVIDLKNEKRINTNGEWDKVTTHPNNKPIFRQNGYRLEFDSSNSDYLQLPSNTNTIPTFVDVDVEFDVDIDMTGQTGVLNIWYYGGYASSLNKCIQVTIRTDINYISVAVREGSARIFGGDITDAFNGEIVRGVFKIENGIVYWNGVQKIDLSANNSYDMTIINSTANFQNTFFTGKNNAGSSTLLSGVLNEFIYNSETFNPININSNAQIIGSSGTVAQVNTSSADTNYILETMFQKSSFALIGNGTTEKIIGHLGTELILTSTPLEGGFTLDGVIYNLTEGLSNEIKSTTGETASIQGFTGTDLNFGGWLKGNDTDGWTPYTI